MRDFFAVLGIAHGRGYRNRKLDTTEFCGPCPFGCGAKDAFHMYPEMNYVPDVGSLGWYLCMDSRRGGRNGCGRSGDIITAAKKLHGIEYFLDACEYLEIDAQKLLNYRNSEMEDEGHAVRTIPHSQKALAETSKEWQEVARSFAWVGMGRLQGQELAYLRERGLTTADIQDAMLGYYPDYKRKRADKWGYAYREHEKPFEIRIPRGIVIPWFHWGNVVCLRFRRLPWDESDEAKQYYGVNEQGEIERYRVLFGSASTYFYGGDRLTPGCNVAMLEGEFDALIARRNNSLVCIATGSTAWGRTNSNLRRLAMCEQVLLCFDNDAAGNKAADNWARGLRNVKRWRPLWSDANAMANDGVNLATWLNLGLESVAMPMQLPVNKLSTDVDKPDESSVATDESVDALCHEESRLTDEITALMDSPPLCLTCFDTGRETEALPDDHKGTYYCAQHHPLRDQAEPCILSEEAMELHQNEPITTVQGIERVQMSEGTTYVVDLETTGLDPRQHKIVSIALGTPAQVWIIDMRPYYSLLPSNRAEWKRVLQILFSKAVLWAGHNLKFDLSFLSLELGVQLRDLRVYDTMLVERLIHAGLRLSASMKDTCNRYGLSVSKEERSWFVDLDKRPDEWGAPFPSKQLAYMRQDIEIPHVIMQHQQAVIEQQGLARVVALENEALPAVVAMELAGVQVDTEHWRKVLINKCARLAQLQEQIQQVLGEALVEKQACAQQSLFDGKPVQAHVSLSSNEQLKDSLHALGIKVTSTNAVTLAAIKDAHPVVPLIQEWKKLQKFVSSFGETFLEHVGSDNRIHATFDQLGADSGRFSCYRPNLQQIPKEKDPDADIRRCFIARPGYTLLIADLSNIELRILADVSGDATMLKFFTEGKDLHSETARLMFHLSPEVNPKEHYINGVKVRDVAKTINFGLAYGMGAQGLANRVKGCSLEQARTLMRTYFNTYKDVEKYLKVSGHTGVSRGYALSLAGRRRNFSQDELSNPALRGAAERSAKNHPIQATNADILKRALALLSSKLPDDAHIVMTIHDELVLECPVELQDEVAKLLQSCLYEACTMFLKRVHIPEEKVLISPFWKKD